MRVVDISSFFSDSCGGIKTYYRNKSRLLPALGVDCHFVVPGAAPSEEPYGAATMHRVPGPTLFFNRAYRRFGTRAGVSEIIARLCPDVIEVGSHYVLPAWVARAADEVAHKRGGRAPALVGFFHSDIARTLVEPATQFLPRPVRAAIVDATWSFVRRRHSLYAATLVASRRVAEALAARGIPRVQWVGLGADVDLFRPQLSRMPHPPRLGYAGRLSTDKGLSLLLEAFPRIHEATGAELRVVGDGPQRKDVEALSARLPAVHYDGLLQKPEDVAAFLGAADVVVTPGSHETFSLSTAEALSCGTPVVAPDEGGAGELVGTSGGGALFAPGDVSGLADAAVKTLQLSPEARAALGARGRAHVVAEFSWPAVARRIKDVYENVARA